MIEITHVRSTRETEANVSLLLMRAEHVISENEVILSLMEVRCTERQNHVKVRDSYLRIRVPADRKSDRKSVD